MFEGRGGAVIRQADLTRAPAASFPEIPECPIHRLTLTAYVCHNLPQTDMNPCNLVMARAVLDHILSFPSTAAS